MKNFVLKIYRRLTGRPLVIVSKDNSPLVTFYMFRRVPYENFDFELSKLNDYCLMGYKVENVQITPLPYYPGITYEPRVFLSAKLTMPINTARSFGFVR